MHAFVIPPPQSLYLQGKNPRHPLDRRWVYPRAGLDAMFKTNILSLPLAENRTTLVQTISYGKFRHLKKNKKKNKNKKCLIN
jgi:hypothetical protein